MQTKEVRELRRLVGVKKREQEKCERRHLLVALVRRRFTDDALGRHNISLADWGMTAEQFTCILLWPTDEGVPPSAIKDDFKSWMSEHGRALAREIMEQVYGEKIFFVYDAGTSVGLHASIGEGITFYADRGGTTELGEVPIFSLPRSAAQAWQSLDPGLRNTFPERLRFVRIE